MAPLGAFLLALTAIGAPGGSVEAVGPTLIPRVDEFIDAPRSLFGRTRAEIEKTLGPPLAVHERRAPSARAPRVTLTAQELAYRGLLIRLSPSASLERVEITTPAYPLPGGLNIGALRHLVEEALGEPQETTDTRSLYLYSDGYPDTVEFHFIDGRVRRIEWNYWVGE